jgi:hypothetical protein
MLYGLTVDTDVDFDWSICEIKSVDGCFRPPIFRNQYFISNIN